MIVLQTSVLLGGLAVHSLITYKNCESCYFNSLSIRVNSSWSVLQSATRAHVQAGGNLPLYGICMYSEEVLHRPPMLARERYSNCKAPYRQCLIAAPRCYCILSQYPFFPLHFQVRYVASSKLMLVHQRCTCWGNVVHMLTCMLRARCILSPGLTFAE